MTFVVEQFIDGLPQLTDQFTASVTQIQNWLTSGPLHFSEDQIRQAGDSVVKSVQSNRESLTSGALTTATVIGEIFTGALLTLFTLIFFLYGGDQIWQFVTRIVPTDARRRVRIAGSAGFGSLIGYVRATVAVAAADAIGIGAGLAILGVPLALPLASLVFIGAFIPIVGAFLTGFLAVLVALVTKGFLTALIVLGIIIGVMAARSARDATAVVGSRCSPASAGSRSRHYNGHRSRWNRRRALGCSDRRGPEYRYSFPPRRRPGHRVRRTARRRSGDPTVPRRTRRAACRASHREPHSSR